MKPTKGEQQGKGKAKYRFPWLLLLILLGTIYAFWILPLQLGQRPVRVEFVGR